MSQNRAMLAAIIAATLIALLINGYMVHFQSWYEEIEMHKNRNIVDTKNLEMRKSLMIQFNKESANKIRESTTEVQSATNPNELLDSFENEVRNFEFRNEDFVKDLFDIGSSSMADNNAPDNITQLLHLFLKDRAAYLQNVDLKSSKYRLDYYQKHTKNFIYQPCRWSHLAKKLLLRQADTPLDLKVGIVGGSNSWYTDFPWRYYPQLESFLTSMVKQLGGTLALKNLAAGGYSSCTFAVNKLKSIKETMFDSDIIIIETPVNDIVHLYDQGPNIKNGEEQIRKCTEFVMRTIWDIAPNAIILMIGLVNIFERDRSLEVRPVCEAFNIPVFYFWDYLLESPEMFKYTKLGGDKQAAKSKDPEKLVVQVDDVHVGPFGASIIRDWIISVLFKGISQMRNHIKEESDIHCDIGKPKYYDSDDEEIFSSSIVVFDREELLKGLYDPFSRGCLVQNPTIKEDEMCIDCPIKTHNMSIVIKKRDDPKIQRRFVDLGERILVRGGWMGCFDRSKCHPQGFLFNNDVYPSSELKDIPKVIGANCSITFRIPHAHHHFLPIFSSEIKQLDDVDLLPCDDDEADAATCKKITHFGLTVTRIMSYDRMGMFYVSAEIVPLTRGSKMMETHPRVVIESNHTVLVIDKHIVDGMWSDQRAKISVPQTVMIPFDPKATYKALTSMKQFDILVHIEPRPISYALQARSNIPQSNDVQQKLGNKVQIVGLGLYKITNNGD